MSTQHYREIVEEARRKVAETRSEENLAKLADALGSLANQLAEDGHDSRSSAKYDEAIRHHLESRAIRESIGDDELKAQSCFNLGAIYARGLRQSETAKNYLLEGLALTTNPSLYEKYEPHLRDIEFETGQISFIIRAINMIGDRLLIEAQLSFEEFAIIRRSSWWANFSSEVEALFRSFGFQKASIGQGHMQTLHGLEGLRLTIEPSSLGAADDERVKIVRLLRPALARK